MQGGNNVWPAVFQGVDHSETRRFADFGTALDRDMDDVRQLGSAYQSQVRAFYDLR